MNNVPLKTMTLNNMLSTIGSLGELVYIPDLGVGGSVWFFNGSVWNAVNNKYILHNLSSPVAHSGAFAEEILSQIIIPANTLKVGDFIETDVFISKSSNVESANYRHRFGPLGTKDDPTLGITVAQPSGTTRNTRGLQEYKVTSSTEMSICHINTTVTLGTTPNTFGNTTIDLTVPNYLSLSIATSSAITEIVTISKFTVKHKTTR